MGLPFVLMNIPKCFAINFVDKLICFFFKMVLIPALTYLGLLKHPEQASTDIEDETTNYLLLIDRRCQIPVPVSVDILIAIIKKKLVVKKFSSRLRENVVDEDEECMCPVCLDCFKKTDEIRELCNCNHVFHRKCLDTWLDLGRLTCPLCRSMLFPDDILLAERKTILAAADSILAEN